MGADALPVTFMLVFAIISFARLASCSFSSALTMRATSQSPSQVILVHPSDNLSAVLTYASPGDVLLLANGVYQPGNFVTINKNITIAAQTDGRAVIDGQHKHSLIKIYGGTVALKGLIITNGAPQPDSEGYWDGVYIPDGNANFVGCNISNNRFGQEGQYERGGGVSIYGGNVNFNHCHLNNNEAVDFGAGMYIEGSGTQVTISHTNIFSNRVDGDFGEGGGVYIGGGNVNFDSCNITANFATSGGGMFVSDGQLIMQGCNITSNSASKHGGGIYAAKQASQPPKLDNKTLVNSNKPDDCYGFWSSPACFGSAVLPRS